MTGVELVNVFTAFNQPLTSIPHVEMVSYDITATLLHKSSHIQRLF